MADCYSVRRCWLLIHVSLWFEFISKKCIPDIIKKRLNNLEWFDKGNLPTKQEWNKLGISIIKKTHDDLSFWVEQKIVKQEPTILFKIMPPL